MSFLYLHTVYCTHLFRLMSMERAVLRGWKDCPRLSYKSFGFVVLIGRTKHSKQSVNKATSKNPPSLYTRRQAKNIVTMAGP